MCVHDDTCLCSALESVTASIALLSAPSFALVFCFSFSCSSLSLLSSIAFLLVLFRSRLLLLLCFFPSLLRHFPHLSSITFLILHHFPSPPSIPFLSSIRLSIYPHNPSTSVCLRPFPSFPQRPHRVLLISFFAFRLLHFILLRHFSRFSLFYFSFSKLSSALFLFF